MINGGEVTHLPENIRLVLQCIVDKDGSASGLPDVLEDSQDEAILMGFLNQDVPVGGGLVSYSITPLGKDHLSSANQALGDNATRYAHRLKEFGHLEPVVYGWPILVPLSTRTRVVQGCLVVDDRPVSRQQSSFLRWLFGGATK